MLIVYFVRPRNKTLFSDDVVTFDAVSDVNVSNLLPVFESIASHWSCLSPVNKNPSDDLLGDALTNSGMVYGNFFNPSRWFNTYRLPSRGSVRKYGLK